MNKIIFLICFLFCSLSFATKTRLEINNVYKVRLVVEVKCDYDWQSKNYIYYKVITIPKKGKIVLEVPSNMNLCEIWPLDFKIL